MSVLQVARPAWRTEEIEIFADAALRFFERECAPHNEKWIDQGYVDRDIWFKAGEAGLLCASMPEDYGGAGGTFAHESVIVEAMAKALVDGFGLPLHNCITTPYFHHYGTEEQKRRWLPGCATGEYVTAIAMTEPGTGSDLQSVRTTARLDGDHYVINGQKTFITNGQTANLIIVVCKTDADQGARGISLIVVETDKVEGFRRGRNLKKMGAEISGYVGTLFRRRSSAGGESSGSGAGPWLHSAHGAIAAGTASDRCSGSGSDRERAGSHHRLCEGAQGLRQAAP